jgi:hypothetical protein
MRVAKFALPFRLVVEGHPAVRSVMDTVIVLKAEQHFLTMEIEYTAIADFFPESSRTEEVPWFDATLTPDRRHFIFEARKPPAVECERCKKIGPALKEVLDICLKGK